MYRIGIDLGGTNIKVGIVNKKNEIIIQCHALTNADRPASAIVDDMVGLCKQLMKESGITLSKIAGLGIGSPGAIDSAKGIVIYSNNFSWTNVPLLEMMKTQLRIPMEIANDAQCATLGENVAGAGADCKNMILVTLGTGVGGGIIVDGTLFTGGGAGAVIGHMVIHRNGQLCTCGRNGCLEAYASATALIRETKKAIEKYPQSELAKLYEKEKHIGGRTVFDAAALGDETAKQVITEYIECLGEGLANLVDIFRPEKILVSGGVSNQEDNLLIPLEKYIHAHSFAGNMLALPKVERAALGNTAGIIGAASLIRPDSK